jgi:hypothetical protein
MLQRFGETCGRLLPIYPRLVLQCHIRHASSLAQLKQALASGTRVVLFLSGSCHRQAQDLPLVSEGRLARMGMLPSFEQGCYGWDVTTLCMSLPAKHALLYYM